MCEELLLLRDRFCISDSVNEKLVTILAGSLDNTNKEIILISLKSLFNAYDFMTNTIKIKEKRDFVINNVIKYSRD